MATPRDVYELGLQEAGLNETALGRDWLRVAKHSLERPAPIQTPYREVTYLDPSRAVAIAYRVELARGQRLVAKVETATPTEELQIFLDLFYELDSLGSVNLVRSADSLSWEVEYVARRPGNYILRMQPELLRGGRFTMTMSAHASLAFPVAGHDLGAVRSGFGAPRDDGRREHHGLDIFARRGTPVLAGVAGQARPSTNGLGGNIVWLRDNENGRSLYYAHLDRWAFERRRWVEPGDTIGFVGNSGNARTTPPHLHFGIYWRGAGAVDPYPQLYESPNQPATFAGELGWVGEFARVPGSGVALRSRPSTRATVLSELPQHASFEILAGSGSWYRVRLPDAREGFVPRQRVELMDTPVRLLTVAEGSAILSGPSSVAVAQDTVVPGETVPLLGTYGDYYLVENDKGVLGWVPSGMLSAVADLTDSNN